MLDSSNIWNRQITQLLPKMPLKTIQPRFVFRTVSISKVDYLAYISEERDGKENKEADAIITAFDSMGLPQRLLVVELSLPQLFPANKRKIGEFIFDASKSTGDDILLTVNSAFCFGRMPGEYLYFGYNSLGRVLLRRKSKLVDHTRLLYT